MSYAVFYQNTNGRVVGYTSMLAGDEVSPPSGCSYVQAASSPSMPSYYDGTRVINMPVQPSESHIWSWSSKAWEFSQPLADDNTARLSLDALAAIDTAAGNSRMKYITSVPGQSETYQRKEEQARAWQAASFAGDAPSFIAAEATALGINAQVLALQIIALADYWGDVKGPQIEAARRKAKVAIEAAGTDDAAIITARDAGITELASL